jgi:hypothetical protein
MIRGGGETTMALKVAKKPAWDVDNEGEDIGIG